MSTKDKWDWGGITPTVNSIEVGVAAPGKVGTGTTLSGAELGVLDAVTAGTVTASKALVVDANKDLAQLGEVHANQVLDKKTQTAVTDTATITAAQLLTKVLDGTPTAAATYTLPTAALLVAGMTSPAVGDSFLFVVNNKSAGANTITVAAGSGGTGDGTLTVDQNVIRAFLVLVTNVTASSEAYFVYGLGA